MENQDIFNQFKKAADSAESPDFASMDKVWHRVEEKLDQKELKKETVLWKKWAVAASVLLGISIGYQFLKEDQSTIKTNEIITSQDTVPKVTTPNNAVVAAEAIHPVIKKEANQILEKQITWTNQVAMEETIPPESIKTEDRDADAKYYLNPAPAATKGFLNTDKTNTQNEKSKDVEVFMNKENRVSATKKEAPLLVFDDKVTKKQSVREVEMEEIESIVEFKEPLYIINGIEYSEEQLFGPNPTSPYAPLNQQEIDSISILQDEKAVEKYGHKGKKGVVIIFTKNGKPAAKKAK